MPLFLDNPPCPMCAIPMERDFKQEIFECPHCELRFADTFIEGKQRRDLPTGRILAVVFTLAIAVIAYWRLTH